MNPARLPSHSTPAPSHGGGLLYAPWLAALAASTVLLATASTLALAFDARRLFRVDGQTGFGRTVSNAGDFNGDGYADVIVGMPTYAGDFGRVFFYYGGPNADAVPDLTVTGLDSGYRFGASVSAAGDVNGDGYDDVIVGAPNSDFFMVDAGQAYVYYGGPAPDAVADLTLNGEAAGDLFGTSVSGAGDVNGDGYDDLIVGAPGNDVGASNAGRVYVYRGGPAPDNVADWTPIGFPAGDGFGQSVGAGDFNGDGFGDLIAGAPYNDATGADAGRVMVLYGPNPGSTGTFLVLGESAGNYFGWAVAGAGDVTGSGLDAFLVGAPGNDAGGTDAGRAYLFSSNQTYETTTLATLTGIDEYDEFGGAVSGAGDVNGDGFADFVVGSGRLFYTQDPNVLYAHLHFGKPTPDATVDAVATTYDLHRFGSSVSGAGDFDGDGLADFIVGGAVEGVGGLATAQVFSGRPYRLLSPTGGEKWVGGREARVRWVGANLADLWISIDGGASYVLHSAGVGGFPSNDVAIMVPTTFTEGARLKLTVAGESISKSTSEESDGLFSIVAAVAPPASAARLMLSPAGTAGDLFGQSVAAAGDLNGDGYPDFVVGSPESDPPGQPDAGRAYVYFGGPGADAVADLTLLGADAGDGLGSAVSGAGDVNGDGYDDLLVGAWLSDFGAPSAGAAFVYYGGPAMDASPDLVLSGEASGDYFGGAVAAAGDVNGDGYADVIVGAPLSSAAGFWAGRAYVFYGSAFPSGLPDLTLTGEAANDAFGISVSTAGDVNGDGFSDFAVGAPGNDAGGSDAGRGYLYFGGRAADGAADLTLTGEAAGDNFGRSVAGVESLNGDGFSDWIIGAPGSDTRGPESGLAYVYHGASFPDARADMLLVGARAGDSFGTSVGGAGDANRDGYSDLVVGSVFADAGAEDGGAAYVYYGGPGADGLPDLTMAGATAFSLYGISVAGVGDMSGDGFGDVIVGAHQDAGAGRAYLYDCKRYFLAAPNGGETWNVGAAKTITWLGAEPANVWLSTDGGNTFEILEPGAGGAVFNTLSIRVPHAPTKFALVRVTPANPSLPGSDRSDSLFTIQTSVALLSLLAAPLPQGGASVTWRSDPGPADLAGYRLERRNGAADWTTIVALTKETEYVDPSGGAGSSYRLFAVNGFGEELWLGETSIRSARPLSAWPLPYRGGDLSVSFATAGGLGGGSAAADVAIFDVRGRLVRRIAGGTYPPGYHSARWDGRDESGRQVASGVYLLRTESGGEVRSMRLTVLR